MGMRLKDWLQREGVSCAEFALRINMDRVSVWRIAEGLVLPKRGTMRAIQSATHGQVTAADLACLASTPQQVASDAA